MSDLAPFVSATIRDRVVAELQEELEREKSINADLKSIQVVREEDDGTNNPVVVRYAIGPIPEGAYVDLRRSFDSLQFKVTMLLEGRVPLPPTLEAIQTLKVRMGCGWYEKTIFGEFADPHVVPKVFDASTRTGLFELSGGFGHDRVKTLGLAVHPIESVEQYRSVFGAPVGGVFSRLVQWISAQQQPVQVWVESVSLVVEAMQTVLTGLRVPAPPPPPQNNFNFDVFGAQWRLQQAIQQAQMDAFNAQLQAQMTARQAQHQQQMIDLQIQADAAMAYFLDRQ